jgi:hypothetical protein
VAVFSQQNFFCSKKNGKNPPIWFDSTINHNLKHAIYPNLFSFVHILVKLLIRCRSMTTLALVVRNHHCQQTMEQKIFLGESALRQIGVDGAASKVLLVLFPVVGEFDEQMTAMVQFVGDRRCQEALKRLLEVKARNWHGFEADEHIWEQKYPK